MNLVRLEDDLKLNVPEIDAQHENLVGLINQLHEAMMQQASAATLDGILARLLEYTRDHFAFEERLMSRHDYPRSAAHGLEHNKLLQRLENLIARFRGGDLLMSFAVVIELQGWATVHIAHADRLLGVFLKDRERAEVGRD